MRSEVVRLGISTNDPIVLHVKVKDIFFNYENKLKLKKKKKLINCKFFFFLIFTNKF